MNFLNSLVDEEYTFAFYSNSQIGYAKIIIQELGERTKNE